MVDGVTTSGSNDLKRRRDNGACPGFFPARRIFSFFSFLFKAEDPGVKSWKGTEEAKGGTEKGEKMCVRD